MLIRFRLRLLETVCCSFIFAFIGFIAGGVSGYCLSESSREKEKPKLTRRPYTYYSSHHYFNDEAKEE